MWCPVQASEFGPDDGSVRRIGNASNSLYLPAAAPCTTLGEQYGSGCEEELDFSGAPMQEFGGGFEEEPPSTGFEFILHSGSSGSQDDSLADLDLLTNEDMMSM